LTLQGALLRYCEKESARVGVGYKQLTGGESAFVDPDSRFSTASVFKVFVLVDLYRRFLDGRLDPDRRVLLKDADRSPGSGVLQYVGGGASLRLRDYARLMMIISDNTAADVLFDYLGPKSIADTVSWLGLKNTSVGSNCKDILTYERASEEVARNLELLGLGTKGLKKEEALALLRRNAHRLSGIHTLKEIEASLADERDWKKVATKKVEDDDVTSPRDLVTTLERVYRERVLGGFTEEFLEIMAACETGQNRIRRGIPRSAILAHKTGTVRGVVNDAGIVMQGKNAYALAVLVNGIPVNAKGGYLRKGEKMIAGLSALVWKAQ
jgi:beta-lactamase class A